MKIAALIGEPATGKSAIARELIKLVTPGEPFRYGLLTGSFHARENLFIFGQYDPGQIFAGTDRLSMGVQPNAESFIAQYANCVTTGPRIFFEGDRLGNRKFFQVCKSAGELKIFSLSVSDETKTARHRLRGDSQTETFLKGRKTKITNIEKDFEITKLPNEMIGDGINAAQIIFSHLIQEARA